MAAAAILAAIVLLSCASAENVSTSLLFSTSLLLPNGLFTSFPIIPQAFVGQVTVARSTTYYTVDCDSGPNGFFPGNDGCSENSYTFSESSSTTQYVVPE